MHKLTATLHGDDTCNDGSGGFVANGRKRAITAIARLSRYAACACAVCAVGTCAWVPLCRFWGSARLLPLRYKGALVRWIHGCIARSADSELRTNRHRTAHETKKM